MATPSSAQQQVTQLLVDWSSGDTAALDKLIPLVQLELHRLAHYYMSREKEGHTLQTTALVTETRAAELLALDEALENLATFDPRMSNIVEMRYFGGLSNEEIAEVLKIHPNTVMRDWSAAKAWLYAALSGEEC